jgi:hypothetical protein
MDEKNKARAKNIKKGKKGGKEIKRKENRK